MVVGSISAIVRNSIILYKSINQFWQVKNVLYSEFMRCYSSPQVGRRLRDANRNILPLASAGPNGNSGSLMREAALQSEIGRNASAPRILRKRGRGLATSKAQD
jgi:hypothetical protein